MKKIFNLTLILISGILSAQKDTVVNVGIYESYYSYTIGQPVNVVYKLYKGGGDCDRKEEGFRFKRDTIIKNITATIVDYSGTGYDQGHLANAEDFAYDCDKENLTFRFYNCIPQTAKLNRGIWKVNETELRKLSQTDSLLITCGGILTKDSKPIKPGSRLIIPTYCYKTVVSLSTGMLIQCLLFDNNNNPTSKTITLNELDELIINSYFIEKSYQPKK